ncbi:cytochrome c1 [Wolbachia endosymbiont of Howardula sp.]|uniref:cytochrome c1 n=1 Tax=Wolbachia endosymbiont of Howardula sp. TaxID=2916816 RepID=UPI00217D0148|nr:cytochrome c1 [Wolbachia endosymbiont of Howardula sp.]UWI83021.1 cytochrome c1 [Wolbachia endosymbiont of Howardula sp.]
MPMKNFLIILCLSISLCYISSDVHSEEYQLLHNKQIDWSFNGMTGFFNRKSIRRGFQVYQEVCATCHSMNKIAFRNLEDIGFSAEEIKKLAYTYQVKDGPNDIGEMFERPGMPTDYFLPPFESQESAAFNNNGVIPPDLSLIIKARHDGANYIFSLLTGYINDEQDENGLYFNAYFPTARLAMAPPLYDGIIEYHPGKKKPTVENMAYDVVNFLQWAAEPELELRHKLGFKVLSYCIILTLLFFITNYKIWNKLYQK